MPFFPHKNPVFVNRRARPVAAAPLLLSALTAALLSACGGGGGGGETVTPVTPPVVVVKTTLSGTAATGAAMAGATVRVKCVAGTGTATATATGAYTLELSDATLPCVVSATSSDGATVLHSLANPAGGTTQTININPLTELLVARVASSTTATTPASFYSGFGAATAGSVTAASITSAATSVVATLKTGGVDFSAIGNPITAPLVVATGTTAGNAYDQALDALGTKLRTAGTTVAQLATQVAAAAAPAASGASTVVGLPPAMLLQPASPTCASLRSGSYRHINPDETVLAWSSSLIQIDAPTGTIRFHDNSTGVAVPDGAACTFKNDAFNLRGVVSPAGVIIWTSLTNDGRQTMAISFPEQPAAVTDLAGTWNVLEFNNIQDQTSTPLWVNDFTQAVFAADGSHQSLVECFGLAACTPVAGPLGTVRVNANGGLDYVNGDGNVARMFIYRPASGDPMLVMAQPNSFFAVASLRRSVAVRPLGDTWSAWDLNMNYRGIAQASFADSSYTTTAVDATTQSYTRRRADGRVDTLTANKPRDGLLYRPAGTSTLTNGSVVTLGEMVVMPLAGTGVSVYGAFTTVATRSQGFYGFAVGKP